MDVLTAFVALLVFPSIEVIAAKMDRFCAAMQECISTREFRKMSVEDAADLFVSLLEENGFKCIASDFDSTMISGHSGELDRGYILTTIPKRIPYQSGGYCDPKKDVEMLSSVTDYFKAVGERLKRSPIKLVVVTFSDDTHVKNHPVYISGGRMVAKALEYSNCTANIEKVYDFYPRFWESPSRYKMLGLNAPMPMHKEYHLNKICSDFNIKMKEIILIDDDIYNCKNAKKIGAAALHVLKDGFRLPEVALL